MLLYGQRPGGGHSPSHRRLETPPPPPLHPSSRDVWPRQDTPPPQCPNICAVVSVWELLGGQPQQQDRFFFCGFVFTCSLQWQCPSKSKKCPHKTPLHSIASEPARPTMAGLVVTHELFGFVCSRLGRRGESQALCELDDLVAKTSRKPMLWILGPFETL